MLHKLLKKIDTLPNLELDALALDELHDIVTTLEIHHLKNFQKILKAREDDIIYIEEQNFPFIIEYMQAWVDIAEEMLAWIKLLHTAWFKITDKSIGNDELLPLMITLLPSDKTQLQLLQEKIFQATSIIDKGEYAFYFTNLYSAASAKAEEKMIDGDDSNKALIETVAKKAIELELEPLRLAWFEFKAYLLELFIKKLTSYDSSLYKKYFVNNSLTDDTKEQIVIRIIHDIETGAVSITDEILSIVMDKYLIITDMCYTLSNHHYNNEKILDEFSVKFFHHNVFLQKNTDSASLAFIKTASSYLGMNRLYDFLEWKSKEEKYLAIGGLFSQPKSIPLDEKRDCSSSLSLK